MNNHATIPYNAVTPGYFAWFMRYRDCTPLNAAMKRVFGRPVCECDEAAPHSTGMCRRCAQSED